MMLSIHSTVYSKVYELPRNQATRGLLLCGMCQGLLSVKVFQNALAHPTPNSMNAKFTPCSFTASGTILQDVVKSQLGVKKLLSSVCLSKDIIQRAGNDLLLHLGRKRKILATIRTGSHEGRLQ